jgi:hypothetical protein
MRKNALTITLTTLVLGIFGAFLRWLQAKTAFEESGLATPGAALSIVYLLYSLAAVAVLAFIVFGYLRRYSAPREPSAALRCGSVLPQILAWLLCAGFVCAAVAALFSAGTSEFPLLQRLFGAAGIFAGLCLPLLPAKNGAVSVMSRAAAVLLTFFCCYWMIFAYKLHAENPVVWTYGPEMVAIAVTTLAVYEVAAYYYGHAKPAAALFLIQLAAFLDLSVFFDARAVPLTVILAVFAALLLLLEYLLIANRREGPAGDEAD